MEEMLRKWAEETLMSAHKLVGDLYDKWDAIPLGEKTMKEFQLILKAKEVRDYLLEFSKSV